MLDNLLLIKSQAAVVVHAAETEIISSNPKAQELLRLTENQMLGKDAADPNWKFIDTTKRILPYEQYPVNQVLTTHQELRDLTFGICRPEKDDIAWVSVSADPVFNDKGKIAQVVVTFMDITAHKHAEEKLNREKTFSERLIASSVDDILAFDPNCDYTIWNPGMERIYED